MKTLAISEDFATSYLSLLSLFSHKSKVITSIPQFTTRACVSQYFTDIGFNKSYFYCSPSSVVTMFTAMFLLLSLSNGMLSFDADIILTLLLNGIIELND